MTLATIPSFVILLGILITVHELGHFMVAKALGFKVLKFSIGFGPVIFSRKRGETEYALSLLPLGGFVKFHGEELAEDENAPKEEDPDASRRFFARPVSHRLATVFAGPFMNLVLGIVLYTFLALFGQEVMLPVVGEVQKGMPAEAAGLMKGDRITSIDGRPVETWDDMRLNLHLVGDKEMAIGVLRQGQPVNVTLKPVMTKDEATKVDRPIIGISWGGEVDYKSIPLYQAPVEGLKMTWRAVYLTVEVLARLVSGKGSGYEVGGPIAIADMAGRAMTAGLLQFFGLMAALSVNLAVLNLLPIPILDGGLLVFLGLEAVLGRPVNLKVREMAQQVGMALLLLMIAVVLYFDVTRIFTR